MKLLTRRTAITAALALWAAGVAGGMGLVMTNAARPDAPAAPPTDDRWPDGLPFARGQGRPMLVVCLHPKCPCSDATLETVESLLPRYGGAIDVHVLFAVPEGDRPGWGDTDLVSRARRIPRADVRLDPGGRDCAAFGARTSGQAFLFDGAGRLAFSGGLTPGRGEVGRTAGTERVTDVLAGRVVPEETLRCPVFGCALCRPTAQEAFAGVSR